MIDTVSGGSCEELTFPGILSNSECERGIRELNKLIHPHKIAFWIFLGLFLIFMILTWVMFGVESLSDYGTGVWNDRLGKYVYASNPDYTLTIVYAVLCGVSIIGGIVNIIIAKRSVRGIPPKRTLEFMILTNNQYAAFIKQGYEAKEAYKLTVEWIDRQNMNAEISKGARAISASIFLSNTINK